MQLKNKYIYINIKCTVNIKLTIKININYIKINAPHNNLKLLMSETTIKGNFYDI